MAKYINPPDERPLSDLVSDLTSKLQLLIRKELELARLEISEEVSRGAKGGALVAAGAVAGFVALLLVAFAAAWGLAEVVPAGVAFLIVGVLFLVVALGCVSAGRKKLSAFSPVPSEALTTLKDDVQVAKESLSRGASGP